MSPQHAAKSATARSSQPAAPAAAREPRTQLRAALWALGALAVSTLALPSVLAAALGLSAEAQDLALGPQGPAWPHLLGTDYFGRDLLLRTLLGLRWSLLVGMAGAAVAVGVGTLVGALSGYAGGLVDALLMRLVDVLYSIPLLFLAILLMTLYGQRPWLLFVALGAVGWLTCARMVRAHVLAERERPYVAALRLLGARPVRIVCLHIVPSSWPVIVTAFGLSVPSLVLEEAFLSFLGLGVPPPGASLGSLISDGMELMRLDAWALLVPAVTLAALLLALQRLADSLAAPAHSRSRGPRP